MLALLIEKKDFVTQCWREMSEQLHPNQRFVPLLNENDFQTFQQIIDVQKLPCFSWGILNLYSHLDT